MCFNQPLFNLIRLRVRVRVKWSEAVCLEVVWVSDTITVVSVCSFRVRLRKNSPSPPSRDCLLSRFSSRTPETSLHKEKEAATSAPISAPRPIAWRRTTRTPASPAGRKERGRSRGKLCHAPWAGEWIVKEPVRRYLRERAEESRHSQQLQSHFSTSAAGQRQSASPSQQDQFSQHPPWFSSGPSSVSITRMSM